METVDPRFFVSMSKPGTGQGLFAARTVAKGDFILEYTGAKIPTPYADTLDSRYLFEIDEKWTIDGSPESNTARYINHSCEPNTEAEIEKGHVMIYALKDIQKGEELTIDYDTEYFDEFIRPVGCKCDASTLL